MSREVIEAQIAVMPEGPKKELATYIEGVFRNEFRGWQDPQFDLLALPIWDPVPGQFTIGPGNSVSTEHHENLTALRESAGGWFYVRGEELRFVNLDDWERIKRGELEP